MLRRPTLLVAALLLLVLPAIVASADGVTEVSDTLSVIKEGDVPSNAEVAVDLSQATPLAPTRVLIGRDDVFVDSMTSGVLQSASPLLLVPPEGPVPDFVMDELSRLDAARVTLLGGEAAVQPAVADQLADAGYAVDRKAGNSRFETAIQIAEDAPPATTAILTRAFAHPDATDETQAFADSLAAGGMAAENGWPILLTQTDVLSGPTADYMAAKNYDRVLIMGGTAAISQAVEDAVRDLGVPTIERISGPNRFGTGIEVAKELGADSADDVDRVTLVDGQASDAWAGGFAAAAHSAFFDAPIVLGTGDTLPAETAAWLAGEGATGAFAGVDQSQIRLTCVIDADVCESGRVELGLPPTVPVTFAPATGSTVAPGSTVVVDTNGSPATVTGGTCVDGAPFQLPVNGEVAITDNPQDPTCDLVLSIDLGGGLVQTESATYVFGAPSFVSVALVSSGPDDTAVGGLYPDISDDGNNVVFVSDGDPTGQGLTGTHVYAGAGVELVDVRPDGTPTTAVTAIGFTNRPRLSADGQFVAFTSADPGLDAFGAVGGPGDNIYLRDLAAGETRLLSIDANGDPLSFVSQGAISSNGQFAVYVGDGVGPTGADSAQIFIRDLVSDTIDVVRDHQGEPYLDANVGALDLSADGTTVVFTSSRPDLIAVDTNAKPDVFAYTIPGAGTASGIRRISVTSQGEEAVGERPTVDPFVAVTNGGQQAVFASNASNLDGTPTEGFDVFRHEIGAGRTTLESRADAQGTQLGTALRPDISGGGRFVTFISTGVPVGSQIDTPTSGGCGIYRVDDLGGTVRLDVGPEGQLNDQGSCGFEQASVSSSGLVVFTAQSSLGAEDTNDAYDVYIAVAAG